MNTLERCISLSIPRFSEMMNVTETYSCIGCPGEDWIGQNIRILSKQ